MITFDLDNCTGCEMCMDLCPEGAVSMKDGKPQLNREKCVECGLCAEECPEGVIELTPQTEPVES